MNLFPARVNKILARLTKPNPTLLKMVDLCPLSSMQDLYNLVKESDKVVNF